MLNWLNKNRAEEDFNIINICLLVAQVVMLRMLYINPHFLSPIALLCILLSLVNLNRSTLGFVFLFILPPLLGTLFNVLGIQFPAFYICFLIAVLFWRPSLFNPKGMKEILSTFFLMWLAFFLWYLIGPRNSYSGQKIIYITMMGLATIFGWKQLFIRGDIQYARLAQFMGLFSFCFICIGIDFFFRSTPASILDFDFIRSSYMELVHVQEEMPFTYHTIGVNAMLGVAFLLSKKDSKLNILLRLSLLAVLLFLIIISQARQALLGFVLIVVIKSLISSGASRFKRFVGVVLALVFMASVVTYVSMSSDVYETSKNASSVEDVVNRDYDDAIEMIVNNPIIGTGLGGYSKTGERHYPHNLFLELLCEMGLLGTMVVLSITFIPIIMNRSRWLITTNSGIVFLMIVIPFFIRYMASGDLIASIELLTMLIVYNNNIDKKLINE